MWSLTKPILWVGMISGKYDFSDLDSHPPHPTPSDNIRTDGTAL
jgi:hypothetical protein